MLKPEQLYCDICGREIHPKLNIMPRVRKFHITSVMQFVDYMGKPEKVRLDICEECMDEMKREIQKRISKKGKMQK